MDVGAHAEMSGVIQFKVPPYRGAGNDDMLGSEGIGGRSRQSMPERLLKSLKSVGEVEFYGHGVTFNPKR